MSNIETDSDSTVVELGSENNDSRNDTLNFPPVAVAQQGIQQRSVTYIAQQTSMTEFFTGLNPLVNAASGLLLEIIKIKKNKTGEGIEGLRSHLEAEVKSFTSHAQTLGIRESEWSAGRYLLCTVLDECVTSSDIPGATADWSARSLLATFHQETQGGELFFQVLDRTMQQPAANLYLLELIYLLLSLGFEGKYRMQDRGPIALETQRDSLYRQIRLLRGEPGQDLSKKIEHRVFRNKIYAYVPLWLMGIIVTVCLAVTLYGFSFTLGKKAEPLLELFSKHTIQSAPYSAVSAQFGATDVTAAESNQ